MSPCFSHRVRNLREDLSQFSGVSAVSAGFIVVTFVNPPENLKILHKYALHFVGSGRKGIDFPGFRASFQGRSDTPPLLSSDKLTGA